MLDSVNVGSLRNVIDEEITDISYIDPGYPNTNYVYSIRTQDTEYILKILGHSRKFKKGCLWYGLKLLFGCDPVKELFYYRTLTDFLNNNGTIRVPEIYSISESRVIFGSPYILMEKMAGETIDESSFITNSSIMFQFGEHIGRMHLNKSQYYGNMSDTKKFDIGRYPDALANIMEKLVEYGWKGNEKIEQLLPKYYENALNSIPPSYMAPIMVDIGHSQFLTASNSISALIDLEGFITGPPELELSAIELFLQDPDPFKEGYKKSHGCYPERLANRDMFVPS